MANDGFIEILSPNALADLQKGNAEIVTMIANIDKVGQKMAKISTPSGSDSAIKQLTAQYNAQTKAIQDLQNQIIKLTEAKKVSNQKTQEEITNSRILASNANRQTLATSQLAGAYRNLSAQVAIASEKYQNLIVRGRLATQTQSQFNKELRIASNEFRTLQSRVLQADKAVDKWNRTGERSIGFAKNLMGAFGVVGGVTAFAMITKDVFDQTKEIMSLDNALKLVTDTQENYYNQQAFIARISEAYGVQINDLTKQFTQFYISAKDKIASQEIQQIFESITKAGASMGLSVQSQERAFLALNQMMSKGTIQAEELRGQLGEALPGAFGIMAKAVGVTEKELGKMMKDGELLASDVLPKFAKQLEITYGIENVKRVENLVSAQNRLSNSWTNLVRSMNESETGGLSKFFGYLMTAGDNALKLLIRLNSSWDELYDKTQKEGQEMGESFFNSLTEDKTPEQITELLKGKTSELLKEQSKFQLQVIALQNSLKNSTFSLRNPFGKSRRDEKKEIEDLRNQIGQIEGFLSAIEKYKNKKPITPVIADEGETEAQRKKREAAAKKYADFLEALRKNDYDRQLSDLERELEIIQDNYDNKKNLGNDYILYAFQLAEKEMEIIKFKYKEEMRLAKLNGKTAIDVKNLEKIATNKYYTDQENAFKKHLETLDKIKVENGVKDTGKIADEETYGSGVFVLDPERYKGLVDGFIKIQEEAGKTKEEIAKLKQGFDDFFSSFTSEFLNNSGFGQLSQLFFEIDENGKTMFQNLMDYAKSTETVWDDLGVAFQSFAEIAQEVMNKLAEAEDAKLANTISNLKYERDAAIAFAGESTTAREEIQRQFDERKHQAELKAFENKKKIAKANVLIDTAQAIVSLYAENNWVTATILGAILTGISLFQISQINAQQPPAYEFGTDNHIGGKMKINDQKGGLYKEAVQTPDGKIKVYNERNKILNAPKGTKVFTASETALMFNNDLNNMLLNNGIAMPKVEVNANVAEFETVGRKIIDAIVNKPETTWVFANGDWKQQVKNGNTIKENENKRFNGIGKSV